jgi:hypothetical protein
MEKREIDELRAALRLLQDRQDILDCITREARGRDRQDAELTRQCYWPDGCDEHGPMITPAAEYPERANAGHAAYFSATSHNLTNHSCEIDGDSAVCETYVLGALLSKDMKSCILSPGRYIDHMERRDGEWRIKTRRTIVDMAIEGSAEWLATPALKGFLKGQWSKDDVSYARPVIAGADGARWQE